LDRGYHFCDEPDPTHEGYSLALFCLFTIEADENEKYKHLSTRVTNKFLCLIGIK
jgi:hypothetical protein